MKSAYYNIYPNIMPNVSLYLPPSYLYSSKKMVYLTKCNTRISLYVDVLMPGINFINVLRTAFTLVGPKSVKRY
jgi:hypothetical protein